VVRNWERLRWLGPCDLRSANRRCVPLPDCRRCEQSHFHRAALAWLRPAPGRDRLFVDAPGSSCSAYFPAVACADGGVRVARRSNRYDKLARLEIGVAHSEAGNDPPRAPAAARLAFFVPYSRLASPRWFSWARDGLGRPGPASFQAYSAAQRGAGGTPGRRPSIIFAGRMLGFLPCGWEPGFPGKPGSCVQRRRRTRDHFMIFDTVVIGAGQVGPYHGRTIRGARGPRVPALSSGIQALACRGCGAGTPLRLYHPMAPDRCSLAYRGGPRPGALAGRRIGRWLRAGAAPYVACTFPRYGWYTSGHVAPASRPLW
jgi:hypothetical protein